MPVLTHSNPAFHREIYRAQGGFDSRIKQTMSGQMCTEG